jgi:CMP-N,N'-diacetyllegionaminic acid synthase
VKDIIAIIPARGGSKGILNKNIINFCGKPLVAWSILQAQKTKSINSVYVTSDSENILRVSEKYGAVGIKRPDEISGDEATSESAIIHALNTIGPKNVKTVVMMQATSPLRKLDDLECAIKQFESKRLDSMFSGAILDDFLIWERKGKRFKSLNYDYKYRGRRQDRKPQYVENGSFYIFKPKIIIKGNRLGGKIGVYLMDFWQTFEIDDPEGLQLCKEIFKIKKIKI